MDPAAYSLAIHRLQKVHSQHLNIPLNPPNLYHIIHYDGYCYNNFESELLFRSNQVVSRAVVEEYWALESRKKALEEHPLKPTAVTAQTQVQDFNAWEKAFVEAVSVSCFVV